MEFFHILFFKSSLITGGCRQAGGNMRKYRIGNNVPRGPLLYIHAKESVASRTEILPAFSANFSDGTGCGSVFAEGMLWRLTRLSGIRDYFFQK
jgi:hypothetical protein